MSAPGSDRTVFLDSFRAVTIVMVVAIHARAHANLAPELDEVVGFIVATIAVPSFFLCDGYLLVMRGAGRARGGYWDYLARSAKRLLIPWLVFSLGYAAIRGLFEWAGLLDQHVVVGRTPWQVALEIYSSGIAPQMYFLVSLFLIRTAVPLLRRLADGPVALAWAVFILYALLYRTVLAQPLKEFFSLGFDPVLHAAWGLQFHLVGIALARSGVPGPDRARLLSLAAFGILGGCVVLGVGRGPTGAVQYAYLLGAFFAFVALGERGRGLARFGADSMGIYLLHAPVVLRMVSMPLAAVLGAQWLLYLLVCALAVALSAVAARILRAHPAGRFVLGMPRG